MFSSNEKAFTMFNRAVADILILKSDYNGSY